MHEIIVGDCLDVMKTFPDNHFSSIVTDPPYGLSFMNKGWDHEVPGKEYWEEAFRITKPGGHLLAMGGTRTFHRLACAVEDAGWEIRDCIVWLYGSGFPKSHNRFGIDGWGTALKPAFEPIIMAMKLCEGTFKQNAEKWGQAGINIDGCRIEIEDDVDFDSAQNHDTMGYGGAKNNPCTNHYSKKGRWPANVILDEEAAAMLDEQSGILKSGMLHGELEGKSINQVYGKRAKKNVNPFPSNSGGASRFFYCAKTSSKERNEGLVGAKVKNNHPTVKPLKLMEYLIKLVMPPKGGLLLDPFAGSGSTILAAKRLGFDAIGIEKIDEYAIIARARVDSYKSESPDEYLF